MSFVPLHVYSGHSYLRSGLKVETYVLAGNKLGYKTLGLSDLASLTIAPEFYILAKKNNIKPIIGEDFYIDDILFSFYVLNEEGYKSLLNLGYLIKKGEINLVNFKDYLNGLALIIDITNPIIKDKWLNDNDNFAFYLMNLTKDIPNLFIGINDDGSDRSYLKDIRTFLTNHSYDVIAFPHILYLKKEDALILKMMEAIRENTKLEKKEENGNNFFLNQNQIAHLYTAIEINNTEKLASMVDFDITLKRGKMIKFKNELGLSSEDYLKKLCFDGLDRLGLNDTIHVERLNKELDVINSMGFADYFLIVSDYVNFAKNNNIPVGPGRGSASGSLVAHTLSITTDDPLKYDLLFERFLNKDRVTMPDIDVDFSDLKRQEVIEYIRQKYGADHVAHILTSQTIGARQALRDTGRIFDYPLRDIELLVKLIPNTNKVTTLREVYKTVSEFKKLIDQDKYYLEIVSLASKIEGFPRQSGLHAGGIVLNADSLNDVLPLTFADDLLVEEYEKNYLEDQGFLKMDILAIRNLSIVEECLEKIRAKGINLNVDDISNDDKEAIKLIHDGETIGVFQLESQGMRNAINILNIESFNDIIALLALYRPGPMQEIKTYALRKAGKEKITYLDKDLEPILKSTYGIIVYQEQIMQIASNYAGLSLSEADNFRRAISKKDTSKLEGLKKEFIEGAIKNGHNEKTALDVFNLIYKFANYGFNKSHSLSYSVFSIRMAYLKAHYPVEFYTSILDNTGGESNTYALTISEIKKRGILLKTPDINKSTLRFESIDGSIVFPLNRIKGLFNEFAKSIVVERENNGLYKDFYDFVLRMKKYKLNAPQLMKLIDSGALDSFNYNRASLRVNIPNALIYANMVSDDEGITIIDMSSFAKPKFAIIEDDYYLNLNKEQEMLGFMISGSPLKLYEEKMKEFSHVSIEDITSVKEDSIVVGIIKSIKNIKNKKGEPMCFVTIYDDTGEIEATIFSDVYETSFDLIKRNKVLKFFGRYQFSRNSFIINKIESLD